MEFVQALPRALAQFRRASIGWSTDVRGSIPLTPDLIEGLTTTFLAERFDRPLPTQNFHRAMWEVCCLPDRLAVIAAPRGTSKSTSITHAFGLSALLFKARDYAVIVADTEGQAAAFLGDMKSELLDNDSLRTGFHIKGLTKDRETEFVCLMQDGHEFKVVAKGAEQKVRGLKWKGRRPNLILGDDLENDEAVESKERREKLMAWILNALLPCGSDDCITRIVGTVLHSAGALMNLMKDDSWTVLRMAAHDRGFHHLLWGEKYPRDRLEAIRAGYVSQGKPDGYAREYLNQAVDEENAAFLDENFIDNYGRVPRTTRYAAVDFAVTIKTKSDWTAVPIVGVDEKGYMHIEHLERVRVDPKSAVDMLIAIHRKWRPDTWFMAQGLIDHTIGPFLEAEMRRTQVFLNVWPVKEIVDIYARSTSLRARHKSGSILADHAATWYQDYYQEFREFPRGRYDDIVASMSLICLALADLYPAPSDEELAEVEYEEMHRGPDEELGRSVITGY